MMKNGADIVMECLLEQGFDYSLWISGRYYFKRL